MNWKKILKDSPKAVGLMTSKAMFNDLLGFFDGQGIYILIGIHLEYTREIDEDGNNPHYVPETWNYTIHDNSDMLVFVGLKPNRNKATESAIEKAFEILEERL